MADEGDRIRVLEAVMAAQRCLAKHIEPGGPDEGTTINELLGILDDKRVVTSVRLEEARAKREAARTPA